MLPWLRETRERPAATPRWIIPSPARLWGRPGGASRSQIWRTEHGERFVGWSVDEEVGAVSEAGEAVQLTSTCGRSKPSASASA